MYHTNEKSAVVRFTDTKFDQLPGEIIEAILNNLSIAQLITIKSVSKNWQKVYQTLIANKINAHRFEIRHCIENNNETAAINIILEIAKQKHLFLIWENITNPAYISNSFLITDIKIFMAEANKTIFNLVIANLINNFLRNFASDKENKNILRQSLQYAYFVETDLSHLKLSGANLYKANLSGANLKGTEFSAAKIDGTWFTNAILDNTKFNNVSLRCPVGLYAGHLENYFKNCCSFSGLAQTLSDYILHEFNIVDIEPDSEKYHLSIIKGIEALMLKLGPNPGELKLPSDIAKIFNQNLSVIIEYCKKEISAPSSNYDFSNIICCLQKFLAINIEPVNKNVLHKKPKYNHSENSWSFGQSPANHKSGDVIPPYKPLTNINLQNLDLDKSPVLWPDNDNLDTNNPFVFSDISNNGLHDAITSSNSFQSPFKNLAGNYSPPSYFSAEKISEKDNKKRKLPKISDPENSENSPAKISRTEKKTVDYLPSPYSPQYFRDIKNIEKPSAENSSPEKSLSTNNSSVRKKLNF